MTECEATLLAEAIPSRWLPGDAPGVLELEVEQGQLERAGEALSAQLGEELRQRGRETETKRWVPILLQPAFAAALCATLVLLFFHWTAGGAEHGGPLYEAGALVTSRLREGEWWRVVTAACLHADWPHAVGNAGFLLVLGWAANERFGSGVGLLLWLATAVIGFIVSLAATDIDLTVGASGGLFGLLGAAGGHALRWRPVSDFALRDKLRGGGAAVMLLAFTAFSREANIAAHVGGFAGGVLLGAALPRLTARPCAQLAALLLTALALFVAWHLALR